MKVWFTNPINFQAGPSTNAIADAVGGQTPFERQVSSAPLASAGDLQVSTTKWDGGTLHVGTSMDFDGNAVNLTMAMSLDASANLVVVSTRPDFQGGGSNWRHRGYSM